MRQTPSPEALGTFKPIGQPLRGSVAADPADSAAPARDGNVAAELDR